MHLQRLLNVVRSPIALGSIVALCTSCSEAASTPDENGGKGSGATGGAAGSAGLGSGGTAGSGTAGTTSSSGTGGLSGGSGGSSNTGGAMGGLSGTTGGAGGTTGGAGASTGGASTGGAGGTGGTLSGTGGTAAGAGGTGDTAGGTGGAGGTSAGFSGSAGDGGSAAGGVSGSGGSSSGAGGAGGVSTRSPGCGTPLQRPNPRTQQTMSIAGTTRYYLLDVPANTDNDTPLALVFGLHGYDMNNVAVVDLYNFTSRSNGRAITVLPQGEGPPPGDVSHWGDGVLQSTWMPNETNYTYIQDLMLDLQDRYCIDPSRVFIAGFSMGGFFTNSLACAHPDWFRGFAPVAGGGPGSCANADAKPAMMITHGTADDIVGIESGEGSRDFWVEHNGCMNTSMNAGSFMGCQSYNGCPEASPVLWCVGNWNHTISSTTSANIWSFFDGL